MRGNDTGKGDTGRGDASDGGSGNVDTGDVNAGDGNTGNGRGRSERSDEEAALSERLLHLDRQLAEWQDREEERKEGGKGTAMSAFGQAWRLSSELVAGVAVGAVLGWVLDWWLSTSPWGMIVLLLLGFAAGVMNLLRATGSIRGSGSGSGRG